MTEIISSAFWEAHSRVKEETSGSLLGSCLVGRKHPYKEEEKKKDYEEEKENLCSMN